MANDGERVLLRAAKSQNLRIADGAKSSFLNRDPCSLSRMPGTKWARTRDSGANGSERSSR